MTTAIAARFLRNPDVVLREEDTGRGCIAFQSRYQSSQSHQHHRPVHLAAVWRGAYPGRDRI